MSGTVFPLELPSSADLEQAAQELERKAAFWVNPMKGGGVETKPDLDRAGIFFLAAATYRQVYEERQTREALRAMLQALTSKSIFETVFGADAPRDPPGFGGFRRFERWLARSRGK